VGVACNADASIASLVESGSAAATPAAPVVLRRDRRLNERFGERKVTGLPPSCIAELRNGETVGVLTVNGCLLH
jgi:hypothetical protein